MLEKLNPQQKEAVLHDKGPLLIFAGAGSGKTRVITYRIARLISDRKAEPEEILAVTFTRKAAGEMKERVRDLLSASDDKKKFASRLPYIGTFHSFGAYVLRMDGEKLGVPRGFSIYDPDDVTHLIKGILDDLNIDKKQFNPSRIQNLISSAKNELVGPEEYPKFAQGPFEEVVAEVYPKYEEGLRSQGAVDFDDLQILPLMIFTEYKDVLDKYQKRYRYLLIDEYQDTNMVQYKLVNLLAGKNRNLCVVGDEDQGIYSWRGATIKNILSFERDYPDAKVIKLEKNYRSTKNILDAAHSVISRNNERVEKKLWTDTDAGPKVTMFEAENEREEARFVREKINELKTEETALSEMCVLYRTNAQSRIFEEELLRNAIPYKLVGGVRFYERREIKDMLAYLRFFANPQDELSFQRVINVPPRKVGQKSIEEIAGAAESIGDGGIGSGLMFLIIWGTTEKLKNWREYLPGIEVSDDLLIEIEKSEKVKVLKEKYSGLISLFGKLYETSLREDVRFLIDEILEVTKYESWIDDGTPQAQARKENLFEMKVVAEKYVELGPRDSLIEFLSDVSLVEQDLDDERKEEDAVTLMTLHSAKGLEYDAIFMVGMEEGLFPHSLSFTSPSELEEERRLCYVGITRARKYLFLSFADCRKTYGGLTDRIPSRFISEIPMELVDFVTK
ncbi:UvrD-helicase domain-containing protein [Candidatus Dojkabacteria bacterium]|nr:UvrD-helicase domain-containing protein [Candidatus Dojkabacteria bacterium]